MLELVDGPRDVRFEMAARAAGWDVLSARLRTAQSSARALVQQGGVGGERDIDEMIGREREREQERGGGGGRAEGGRGSGSGDGSGGGGELRERTRWNVQKALRYRSAEDVKRFGEKVREHMVRYSPPPPKSPSCVFFLFFLHSLGAGVCSGHASRTASGREGPARALGKRVGGIGSAILP